MAENNQKQQKPFDDPTNTGAIILDEANKTIRKKVSEGVSQGLDQNIAPNDIIQNLLKNFSTQQKPQQQVSSEDVLKQLLELSGSQIPTGESKSRIGNFIRGGEFKRTPITEDLGITDAAKVLQIQQQQQQAQRGQTKQQLDVIKLLQDIIGGTPEGIEGAEVSKARGQAKAQEAKSAQKTKENFKIAQDKLKLTFETFDKAIKETQNITGGAVSGQGRLGGAVTSVLGAVGANKFVKAFEGQLVETSTAIAKIAAPSAKVGPELIKVFGKTLPGLSFFGTSTTDEAIEQIATSMTNAFINYAITNPEDVPGDVNRQTFQKEITSALKQVNERAAKSQNKVSQSMVDKANALRKQFPNLSKAEIIRRVKSGK